MTETAETFDQWAIIEIMGHDRYAGRVTSQALGGTSFVRVDVPELDGQPGFTKLFGQGAIFSIAIVTQETVLEAVKQFRPKPVQIYGLSQQSSFLPFEDD